MPKLPLLIGLTVCTWFFVSQNVSAVHTNRIFGIQTNAIALSKAPENSLSGKRVGLQVGHWKREEAPDEIGFTRAHDGAKGASKQEWEVNMDIATRAAQILKSYRISVDILPTTVPVHYQADAFVAIHADGDDNPHRSGFRVATPYQDPTNTSSLLAKTLTSTYHQLTQLTIDPEITRNMRGYYAFDWKKYRHAIAPTTPAVILETGFLTNTHDRQLLLNEPKRSADAIAQGVIRFLFQVTDH